MIVFRTPSSRHSSIANHALFTSYKLCLPAMLKHLFIVFTDSCTCVDYLLAEVYLWDSGNKLTHSSLLKTSPLPIDISRPEVLAFEAHRRGRLLGRRLRLRIPGSRSWISNPAYHVSRSQAFSFKVLDGNVCTGKPCSYQAPKTTLTFERKPPCVCEDR